MAEQRELSLKLYDVLEMVGASGKMRMMHRRAATTQEILEMYAMRNDGTGRTNIYQCGSSFEGTVTPDLASDIDLIMCMDDALVVPHRLMAGPDMFLNIVRESWTRPGYVKLQLMNDGRPLTSDDIHVPEDVSGPFIDEDGTTVFYYCDDTHLEVGFDAEGRALRRHPYLENMHGPAIMTFDDLGKHSMDKVVAWKCKGIPLFATEWITRSRRYGWPSQQLIDKLKMMGCLFVGVGHFDSPEKEFEWRLSCSLQERMLMKSLNPVQHKTYILLKMTKKNVLEKCLNEELLSSYMCKTCVFYMAETTPASFWVPENLISCLLQSIKLLLRWVEEQFCPNFFLKDQNLFDKAGFQRLMGSLKMLIELLLQTGHNYLYLLKSDRVGQILRGGDINIYRRVVDSNIARYIFNCKAHTINIITSIGQDRLMASNVENDPLQLYMAKLNAIQENGIMISGHSERVSRAVLRYVLPWLHLHIGLEFASRAIKCQTSHGGKVLMKNADRHLHQARNADLVNTKLCQASILLRLEKLDECFMLLQEVESSLTYRVFTGSRYQSRSHSIVLSGQQVDEIHSLWNEMSIRKIMRKYVALCVIFERSQIELVPHPLQYEMFRSFDTFPGSRNEETDAWFDQAVVDAKVYLYLLQYLVCSKLDRVHHKQIAMDNLASLIRQDLNNEICHICHKETAYNLLGWIYLQENRACHAERCFRRSWELRPNHNAAKFHMRDLCNMFSLNRDEHFLQADYSAFLY